MTFPYRKNLPITIFRVPGIAELCKPSELAVAFAAARVLPILPPLLNEQKLDVSGFAWLDGHNGPAVIGDFCVMLRRQYVKKVARSLVATMHAHYAAQYRKDHGENWKGEHSSQVREGIVLDLLKRTPPDLKESAVLIDIVNELLVIFHPREKVREQICKRLGSLGPDWGRVMGGRSSMDLITYLIASRPGVSLPENVGSRFLHWCFEHAKNRRAIELAGDEGPTVIGLELDGKYRFDTSGSKITMTVAEDEETLMNSTIESVTTFDDDHLIPAAFARLSLILTTPERRKYQVTLDENGVIHKCRVMKPLEDDTDQYDGSDEQIALRRDVSTLLAANDIQYAIKLIFGLFEGFNRSELADMLNEEAQSQLFPGFAPEPVAVHEDIASCKVERNVMGTPATVSDPSNWRHTYDQPVGVLYNEYIARRSVRPEIEDIATDGGTDDAEPVVEPFGPVAVAEADRLADLSVRAAIREIKEHMSQSTMRALMANSLPDSELAKQAASRLDFLLRWEKDAEDPFSEPTGDRTADPRPPVPPKRATGKAAASGETDA